MIHALQTLHRDSPISRLMQYASAKGEELERAARMARESAAKPSIQKKKKKAKKVEMNPVWIIESAKRGSSVTDIAEQMGRSRYSVLRVLGEAGVDMRPLRKPFANQPEPTVEMGHKCRALLKSGESAKSISKELSITARLVWESVGIVGGLK